ncbi:DUF5689 domain-containing protein [Empedobacter stercoris]|uniref:DUF5689 domain-containing protein n=1 Tax=Empedobacter falsenii TaxID=343874 RepID=A0ABY8V8G4_9FLAO|nr:MULTISPECIES: DUF5689 domain-containing protein [Empedobacter]UWX66404.1 DUF5689 domain-containing protein [Empedobacter stercoris]WIH96593.1 DUF5689 domain-containing protein [Empedobacter falsenii]
MNTISKITLATALSLGLFTAQSCVQDDDYSTPPIECNLPTANITLPELMQKVNSNQLNVDENKAILDDLILEAYVISSDETGNIYKTISIQDDPVNPTVGTQIEINAGNLYTKYPLGSKIQIRLKGLRAQQDTRAGIVKIGSVDPSFDIGRIGLTEYEKYVVKTCEPIQAIQPKEFNSLAEAMRNENVNTLVKINNVQFLQPDVDKTYGTASQIENRELVDKTGSRSGVVLRNSNFADWKDEPLPTGSGSITVVVSKYGSTWQVYIRDTKDVNFDQPRFDVGGGQNPGGGNDTEAANLLFKGSDFNVWADFMSSINAKFGLKDYATSAVGLGRDDSNALQIKGTPAGNDYVFTAKLTNELPTNPKKITFYVKGKSGKSLSLNVNKSTTGFTPFNVGELANQPVTVSGAENNQYNGAIDTKGEWVLVTLNIEGLDIQKTVGNDLFSLKVGKEVAYDLIIDNIKID